MGLRNIGKAALYRSPGLRLVAATAVHPTWRGQRVTATARAIRYLAAKRRGESFEMPYGLRSRIVLHPTEMNYEQVVHRNPPNWPEMLVWRRHLAAGDLFVDVGANKGIYTLWALDCGADVVAVEPNAHNAERIRENLRLNGYSAEVLQKALAAQPGWLRMTADLDAFNHIVEDDAGTEVESTTLDDLIGDRRCGVKIDVEGAEAAVLEGARRTLSENRISLLQLEWGVGDWMGIPGRDSVRDLLRAARYELYLSDRTGALERVGAGDVPEGTINVFAQPVA